jgi:hypothetical protein
MSTVTTAIQVTTNASTQKWGLAINRDMGNLPCGDRLVS